MGDCRYSLYPITTTMLDYAVSVTTVCPRDVAYDTIDSVDVNTTVWVLYLSAYRASICNVLETATVTVSYALTRITNETFLESTVTANTTRSFSPFGL